MTNETFKIEPLGRPSEASLNGEQETADFKIERPDWTLFRSLATLSQKAGVPVRLLRRLALKELVDNALDACCASPVARLLVKISEPTPGVYVIEDMGPGIDGPPRAWLGSSRSTGPWSHRSSSGSRFAALLATARALSPDA